MAPERGVDVAYSSCAVVEGPDRLVEVDNIAEAIREGGSLCNGGCNSRLEEIHREKGCLLHSGAADQARLDKGNSKQQTTRYCSSGRMRIGES